MTFKKIQFKNVYKWSLSLYISSIFKRLDFAFILWCAWSYCLSVAKSFLTLVTPWTAACQASLSSNTSWSCANSCPLSWWCRITISSFVTPFSFCLQLFPALGSFPTSLFSSGQIVGVLALASILPLNIQCWGILPLYLQV